MKSVVADVFVFAEFNNCLATFLPALNKFYSFLPGNLRYVLHKSSLVWGQSYSADNSYAICAVVEGYNCTYHFISDRSINDRIILESIC